MKQKKKPQKQSRSKKKKYQKAPVLDMTFEEAVKRISRISSKEKFMRKKKNE